jgi:hypothetical protein
MLRIIAGFPLVVNNSSKCIPCFDMGHIKFDGFDYNLCPAQYHGAAGTGFGQKVLKSIHAPKTMLAPGNHLGPECLFSSLD